MSATVAVRRPEEPVHTARFLIVIAALPRRIFFFIAFVLRYNAYMLDWEKDNNLPLFIFAVMLVFATAVIFIVSQP